MSYVVPKSEPIINARLIIVSTDIIRNEFPVERITEQILLLVSHTVIILMFFTTYFVKTCNKNKHYHI